MENLKKIKSKKEFSQIPDSLIEFALEKANQDVKSSKALLRKYFGVFLTNKVLKLEDEQALKSHISSKKRNYPNLYSKIISNEKTIIDLGAGINGLSCLFFPKKVNYVAVEAVGQLVEKMNLFFKEKRLDAKAVQLNLFEINKVLDIIKQSEKPRIIFMFQIIDALEYFKRDYTKELLLSIKKELDDNEKVVISFSLKSISGKNKFKKSRAWLFKFLQENFNILDEFVQNNEKFVIFKSK